MVGVTGVLEQPVDSCDDQFEVPVHHMVSDMSGVSCNDADVPLGLTVWIFRGLVPRVHVISIGNYLFQMEQSFCSLSA